MSIRCLRSDEVPKRFCFIWAGGLQIANISESRRKCSSTLAQYKFSPSKFSLHAGVTQRLKLVRIHDTEAAQPFHCFVFWAANLRARTRESADAVFKAMSGSGDDLRAVEASPLNGVPGTPFSSVGSSAFLQIRLSSSLWVVSLMISTCF